MATHLTKEEVLKRLEAVVKEHGGVNAFARTHGLSGTYVSLVMGGHRTLGPKLLAALRLRRVTRYERIPD